LAYSHLITRTATKEIEMQIVSRVEVLRFEDRLDRRYAKAVRAIAAEVGIDSKGQLDDVKHATAVKLATGDFPHVAIKFNLFG
jgi:hypothetical protein